MSEKTILSYPLREEARLNQGFGANPQVYELAGMMGHNGLDIHAFEGTEVLAAADGVVAFAGEGIDCDYMGRLAGRCVAIDHGDILTGYAHLVKPLVEEGQKVKRGEVIALSGATGAVTAAHLHFEVISKPINVGTGYFGRVDPGNLVIGLVHSDSEDEEPISPSVVVTEGSTSG